MLDTSHNYAHSYFGQEEFAVNRGEPWINAAWTADNVVRHKRRVPAIRQRITEQDIPSVHGSFVDAKRQAALLAMALRSAEPGTPRAVVYRRLKKIAIETLAPEIEHVLPVPPVPERAVTATEAAERQRMEFTPSPELTAFWVRGLKDHLQELSAPARYRERTQIAFTNSLPSMTEALNVRFKRIFAVIGNRQRYGIEPSKPIATDGRFSLIFQHHIVDRIPIRPDEYGDFFALLSDELQAHLTSGGSVRGSWGHLVIANKEMRLVCSKEPPKRGRGEWQRAEVIG